MNSVMLVFLVILLHLCYCQEGDMAANSPNSTDKSEETTVDMHAAYETVPPTTGSNVVLNSTDADCVKVTQICFSQSQYDVYANGTRVVVSKSKTSCYVKQAVNSVVITNRTVVSNEPGESSNKRTEHISIPLYEVVTCEVPALENETPTTKGENQESGVFIPWWGIIILVVGSILLFFIVFGIIIKYLHAQMERKIGSTDSSARSLPKYYRHIDGGHSSKKEPTVSGQGNNNRQGQLDNWTDQKQDFHAVTALELPPVRGNVGR